MTYEESKYLADPDFLATIEVHDATLDKKVSVEVGYAYKSYRPNSRKLQGVKIVLSPGLFEKQLLYEATTLEMIPFRRARPDDDRQPDAKPRRTVRPTATPSR